MDQSIFISFFSVIVLLLIAATFLFFHLKGLKDDAVFYWLQIREKTRLRIDMIPNLIETIRRYGKMDDKLVRTIVDLRATSWPLRDVSAAKVDAELRLSDHIHMLWKTADQFPELKKDVNFMSLHKDIFDLGKEIDLMLDRYNEKIRHYNKEIKFFIYQPFVKMLGFKPLLIFEFEA